MRASFILFIALSAIFSSLTAWSQPTAPGIISIDPDVALGYDFGDQSTGTSSNRRRINIVFEDFLSGGGTSNLTITVSVTSTNSDFVIDDSGCSSVPSMPSTGIPCSVDVAFSPDGAGPSVGDLIVSCLYSDIFSLGVLSPPSSAILGCRPDTTPDPTTFSAYFSGVGAAREPEPERAIPVPATPAAAIAFLAIVLMILGVSAATRRKGTGD